MQANKKSEYISTGEKQINDIIPQFRDCLKCCHRLMDARSTVVFFYVAIVTPRTCCPTNVMSEPDLYSDIMIWEKNSFV